MAELRENEREYELALRACRGDREAIAELVDRVRLRLFALAYAELRHYDDAHDAVASALLQICLHIREVREPQRVVAWMQSIVRNETRRIRRERGTAILSLNDLDVPDTSEPGRLLLRLDIENALRQLPRPQERALRLFYLDRLSVRDVAEVMGGSEGAVKMWLSRGRQRLSQKMKGYAPMTPPVVPSRKATILHSGLAPDLISRLTAALHAGGYHATVLTPADLGDLNQRAIQMADRLKGCELLVLDEWIGGRPAFEYLLNLKANGETKEIPTCVLFAHESRPDFFTGSAYFSAGVDRLLDKSDATQIDRFANPFRSWKENIWSLFTETARRVIYFSQAEAIRWEENCVSTEHILLGLLRANLSDADPTTGEGSPAVGIRVLTEGSGLSPTSIREEVERRLTPGVGHDDKEMQLTPRAKRVIDLAYDEARLQWNDFIGTEHLLLGMIRERESMAGQVLADLGITLEQARAVVEQIQKSG